MTIPAKMSAEPRSTFPPKCSLVTTREVERGEHGFEGKNQGGMRRRSVLLRPHLGAEGKGGGEDGGHDDGEYQAASPMHGARRG